MKRLLKAVAALLVATAGLLGFEVYWAGRDAPGPYENPDGAPFPFESDGPEPGRVLLVLGDSTAAGQGAP